MNAPHLPCPNCGQPADSTAHNGWRPFCSRRCKLIDLGEWLTEEHHIEGEPEHGNGAPDAERTPGGQH